MTLDRARELAQRASLHAQQLGKPVVIAVTDAAGIAVLLLRMDGAPAGSVDVALAKAACAARFARPTASFAARVAQGETGLVGLPGVICVAGGRPLAEGAIGVSGALPAEDDAIAAAAG